MHIRNPLVLTQHLLGLDLGQVSEPSGLAIVTQTVTHEEPQPGSMGEVRYTVGHLERFPPGTSYLDIAARLHVLCAVPPLDKGTVLVDQTAVGQPVVQLLRRTVTDMPIVPVVLTTGYHSMRTETGGWLIPKAELAGTLQVVLQERRLQVPASLPQTALLVQELQNFRIRRPTLVSPNEQVAWRDGPQDDLVFAVAMAVWLGERAPIELSMPSMSLGDRPRRW